MVSIYDLKCEGEALGTPRFSWKLKSDEKDVIQKSYRLLVAGSSDFSGIIWDSGEVFSSDSLYIKYGGSKLLKRTVYHFKLKIETEKHGATGWSSGKEFTTGRLGEEWKGKFIGAPELFEENTSRPLIFKKEFHVAEPLDKATLYSSALGICEASINGEVINRHGFAPGWTNYHKRLQYQSYELSNRIRTGKNTLTLTVSSSWFAGYLTWFHGNKLYGNCTAVLADLILTAKDGSEVCIATDESWSAGYGPIEYSEFYHGERYNGQNEVIELKSEKSRIIEWDLDRLIPQEGENVAVQEELDAREVITTPAGERVIDFGQNITGTVRFTLKGKKGDRIVIRHGEVLDSKGNFYLENMRQAENKIEYLFNGEGTETYCSRFSFQGFRYIRVEEYPGEVRKEDFTALVIHSSMDRTLEFQCSDELLNRLHSNILWGWKGNSLDVPTDCPQRDERLGWTGDAQVFIPTASYLMDVRSFFRKWIKDMVSEQNEQGGIPHVVPDVITPLSHMDKYFQNPHSSTGWADAVTVCPWTLFKRYGDREILEQAYPAVKKWIAYMEREAEDGLLWKSGMHFGDWLALDAEEGSYLGATPNDFTATAYYSYSAGLASQMAQKLGMKEDEEYYSSLRDRVIDAMRSEYFEKDGHLRINTQTAHILSLSFEIARPEWKPELTERLVGKIRENGGHLDTGFLGTPLICHALSDNGRSDVAYELLLQKEYPSWLYSVEQGATTIWEHWDGIKPDGSMWSADMNSFNHYAYGAVGAWMYKNIGGIDLENSDMEARRFSFVFNPGGDLISSSMRFESVYGPVKCQWRALDVEKTTYELELEVPPNCSAEMVAAGFDKSRFEVVSGRTELRIERTE